MLNPKQRVILENLQNIANFLKKENIDNNLTIFEFKIIIQNKARKFYKWISWFPELNKINTLPGEK